MELSVYDIIKKIIVTEKSADLFKRLGKLTFEVHKESNKVMIRQAVEKIWNVKVENVCISISAGKKRSFARNEFCSSDKKKAIVTLKKGYKIDLPGHFETMGVEEKSELAEKETSLEGK